MIVKCMLSNETWCEGISGPNPARTFTSIRFCQSGYGHMTLKIFSPEGRETACPVDRDFDSGNHTIRLETGDLHPGVYLCILHSNDHNYKCKLVVIK